MSRRSRANLAICKYFQSFSIALLICGCAVMASSDKPTTEPLEAGKEVMVPSKAKLEKRENTASKSSLPDKKLREILGKYKSKAPVKINLKKSLKTPWQKKEKKTSGELFLANGKLRMEMGSPENSVLFLDDDAIWLEQKMGKAIQVSKFPLTDKKKATSLLAIMFEDASALDRFKYKVEVALPTGESIVTYHPPNGESDFTELRVGFNEKKGRITSFSYDDNLENTITYRFNKTQFSAKVAKKKLKYKPPKGVKPIEF